MSSNRARNRRILQIESLDGRIAPSHFGGLAHAAAALHAAHGQVHVHASSTNPNEVKERSSQDPSPNDSATDPKDPSANDTKDSCSKDASKA